jgi:hypothetical protein
MMRPEDFKVSENEEEVRELLIMQRAFGSKLRFHYGKLLMLQN